MSVWRAREAKNVQTYGSARWAEPREVKAVGLLGADGVVLGRLDDDYLRHDGPEHVLCFAPTRSGKGVGLVVPSLLTWPGSAIVHDIKGENWQLTAGYRSRHGRVLLFDPTNAKSSAYNPLLEVRRGEWEVRDVQNVADVLVDPEGSLDKRNHWEKTSHSLLVGAILHVLYAEVDKTLAGVAAFLSDPKRPIETTLQAMMTTPHLGEKGPHPVVASTARELLNKSDNERSGVLSTAMSFLGLYRDPVVAEVTSRCDWRIADLSADPQPATLYLVVPPSDISRTKPLIRLVLNQIGRRLTEDLHARDRRHRILMMLDEFPALGRTRLLRIRAGLHGRLRHQELPDRPIAEPDRESLWCQQLDPRQLPCPRQLCHQRRAHGEACLRCAGDSDGDARHEKLCWSQAESVAWSPHGLAAGDGKAAAHAGRGDAAAAH
ncbi:type IV secretory pathway TraG/TraD family ATPase VirD4 [Bradyrhizobium sp. LM6.11]